MLRMGKNPNEEKSPTQPDTNRSYSPYQSGETYARPATENAATPKALTDCETIAREIKDGTLSGFVGSGTSITGEATFKAGFYTPEDRRCSRPALQHWGCTMGSWMPPGIACVR